VIIEPVEIKIGTGKFDVPEIKRGCLKRGSLFFFVKSVFRRVLCTIWGYKNSLVAMIMG